MSSYLERLFKELIPQGNATQFTGSSRLNEIEGDLHHVSEHQSCDDYMMPPPGKRRCCGVEAVINKLKQKVAHHDSDIEELQRKVYGLEKAMAKSEKNYNITKKRLLRVRRQFKDIQVAKIKIKRDNNGDRSLPSHKDLIGNVKCEMLPLKHEIIDDCANMECFPLDVDCVVEEVENEVLLEKPSSPQPLLATKCPQMLTPVSDTAITTNQLIEGLIDAKSSSKGSIQCDSQPTSSNGTDRKLPTAMPLRPLKPEVKVLASSEIDKPSLFTVNQVLRMFDGQNVAVMASKLAEMAVYGSDVLKKCTPLGAGKKKLPALPREELYLIKQTLLHHTPSVWEDLPFFEEVWRKYCISYIGVVCAKKRSEH